MIKLNEITWVCHNFSMRLNLQMNAGEKVVILGPSGAGKSTLLNLIAGFLQTKSGNIFLNGKDHTCTFPAKRPVSILFQDNNLFSHLTVAENIGLGMNPGLRLSIAQRKQLLIIACQVGLEHLLDRLPATISGGQRQRTALARCLVQQRPILLLDEPFSALDMKLRIEIGQLLNEICEIYGFTLLMVSHNFNDAIRLAPRTLLIVNGSIYYDGSTTELANGTIPEATMLLGIDY